jgi:hypothetical protein
MNLGLCKRLTISSLAVALSFSRARRCAVLVRSVNGLCLAERRDFVNTVKHGRTRSERQVAVATAYFLRMRQMSVDSQCGNSWHLVFRILTAAGCVTFHNAAWPVEETVIVS